MHASPSPRPPQSARRPPATAAVEGARFDAVRAASLALAAPLSDEDCALQSMPDASPVKWHLAHTSWFFETFVLAPSLPGYAPFDAAFRVLFNSYYDAVGERHPRPQRGLLSRPDLATCSHIARTSTRAMHDLLARPIAAATRDLVTLGIHHEQQHQELILTDVKHLLSHNPLKPVYRAAGRWPPSGRGRSRGTATPAASRPSVTPAMASRSTTKRRATASCSSLSRSRRGRSRMASSPISSPTAVIAVRSCGCRSASTPCVRTAGRRRSTGHATTARGRRSRCTAWPRSIRTRRSVT